MAFQDKPQQDRFRGQLFLNFKGGTGKTTLSVAYGLELARKGYRVLFIDLDPQGHLTQCLGMHAWQFEKTLYHALVLEQPIQDVIKKTPGVEASLIPADVSLSATDLSLASKPYREWRLAHALSSIKQEYDVVVLDASPAISLLNLNAILICRDILVPVLPETLSLRGLETLLKTLTMITADFHPVIDNVGVIVNRFRPDEPECEKMRKQLEKAHGNLLLKTIIRDCPSLSSQTLLARFGSHLEVEGTALKDIRSLLKEIAPERPKARKKPKGTDGKK